MSGVLEDINQFLHTACWGGYYPRINKRKISGIFVHGVLHSNGNEWATAMCKNMDEPYR